MKKLLETTILTLVLTFSSLSVSAQLNELKQGIAESNKELPMTLNAVLTLESIKYEAGYVKYIFTIDCSPHDFNELFKNKKREEFLNLESFVFEENEVVSLMIKTNTGLKYVYKCIHSDDIAEVVYSAEEIIDCKQKGATNPYFLLSGMDYIKWYVNRQNEINKNIDSTGFICNGEMYIKEDALVCTVLVPRKGIYEELDFDAVKSNRMVLFTNTNEGMKMLNEMVKLNMSLIFLIKDMHSNKSHQIKCDTKMLSEYVN